MSQDHFDQNIDELLADLHRLLDDDLPKNDTDELQFDHRQLHDTPQEQQTPPPDPNPISQQPSWTATQKLPRHVAKLQRNQEKAYADWLYEQGQQAQTQGKPTRSKCPELELPEELAPPKKKSHGLRNLILILLILVLALSAVIVFLLPQQPVAAEAIGSRKEGISTLLLVGTDAGGMRTDTLMLLTVDQPHRSMHLVSIPRDTMVSGNYTVPKINGVYGINGGGEEGIHMLLTRVSELIGFTPDGYVLVDLTVFESIVDALGGVEFDVPQDMFYTDTKQDLTIDLKAGRQTLNGEEAMWLVRFRSGYSDADLGRIRVQRDFLSALLQQAVSVNGLIHAPQLLQLFVNHTHTDLTVANYLWLARAAMLADISHISTVTLPGNAAYISGGSYYVLDPASVAHTVNVYCNPYKQEITAADLQIRTG